jgi:hypothetical protein
VHSKQNIAAVFFVNLIIFNKICQPRDIKIKKEGRWPSPLV